MPVYQIQVKYVGGMGFELWYPLSTVVRKDKAEAEAMLASIQADNNELDPYIRNEYRNDKLQLS